MLSGRYGTELTDSNWSKNKSGFCLSCSGYNAIEDLNHIHTLVSLLSFCK